MLFLGIEESLLFVIFGFITTTEYLGMRKLGKIHEDISILKSDLKLIYYRLGLLEKG